MLFVFLAVEVSFGVSRILGSGRTTWFGFYTEIGFNGQA